MALEKVTPAAPRDARVLAALAVGGGDLAGALERSGDDAVDDPAVRAKLQRYVIRMSTRPTPYGLFAGVGLARPGPKTDLTLADAEPRTSTRPDMAWLLDFIAALEARLEIRRGLRFRTNTAAWVHAGRVSLAERAVCGEAAGPGEPVSIRATSPVLRALEMAREPCPWEALCEELLRTPGATDEKVEELLTELWRHTLLLSELRPPLTHASPARHVVERLLAVPAARAAAEQLTTLLDEMAAFDASPLVEKADRHRGLVACARALHSGPDVPPLQVDTALVLAPGRLAAAIAETAAQAAELLVRLSPAGAASALHGYRRAFEARYGHEREVRLLELLDPDAGLGPPSGRGWSSGVDGKRSARRDQLLWELAVEAVRDRRREVELDEKTLSTLQVADPPPEALPDSLDLAAFVIARDASAANAGDFLLLVGPNLGAQAAGRNLGRFAHLWVPTPSAPSPPRPRLRTTGARTRWLWSSSTCRPAAGRPT